MKFLRLFGALALLSLMSTVAFAQELSEVIVTTGGMTVRYPATYMAFENEPLVAAISDDSTIISVAAGDAILRAFGITPESPLAAINLIREALIAQVEDVQLSDVEETALGDRPAFRFVAFDENQEITLYAFSLADGTVALAFVQVELDGPEKPENLIALAERIFLTVTIDPANPGTGIGSNASVIPPIEVPVIQIPDDHEGDEDDEGLPPLGEPLKLKQMPEGLVILRTNFVFDRPQGWQADEDERIYTSVSFFRENFLETLLIMDLESLDLDLAKSIYLPVLIMLQSAEDIDPETLRRDETLPDGRAMQVYSTASLENTFGVTVLAFVELKPGRWGAVQGISYMPNTDKEALEAQVVEVARSFRFDVTADPRNSYITLEDGRVELLRTFECYETDFGLFDEEESATGVCPAGCEPGIIWGTDIYTNDSNICTAAAHAGVISLAEGGPITVIREPGQEVYPSSTRNGITSESWGSWGGSFRIEPASGQIHTGAR